MAQLPESRAAAPTSPRRPARSARTCDSSFCRRQCTDHPDGTQHLEGVGHAVPIRRLVVHTDPDGIKAPDAERITAFTGRRGRPVKKPRFLPADLSHQLARRLQARGLGTVSVL
jgi:hypothetical protein